MKRWHFIVVGMLSVVPGAIAQDNAQKQFEAMEQKLASAEGQKITFTAEAKDMRGSVSLKGTLALAKGNRARLVFEAKQGDRPSKVTFVSDGKAMTLQAETEGKKVTDSPPLPEELLSFLGSSIARASITSAINALGTPKPVHPSRLKIWGFKEGGSEKIGDKEARVIEYQMETAQEDTLLKAKLWLDGKSNLPLKRTLEVTRDGMELLRVAETYSEWVINPEFPEESFTLPK